MSNADLAMVEATTPAPSTWSEEADAFWSAEVDSIERSVERERSAAAEEAADASERMGAALTLTDEALSFGVTFGGKTREVTVSGWGLLADEAMIVAARTAMALPTMATYAASSVFFTEGMTTAVVQIGSRRCVVRAK